MWSLVIRHLGNSCPQPLSSFEHNAPRSAVTGITARTAKGRPEMIAVPASQSQTFPESRLCGRSQDKEALNVAGSGVSLIRWNKRLAAR
jgi:hypothetical protein